MKIYRNLIPIMHYFIIDHPHWTYETGTWFENHGFEQRITWTYPRLSYRAVKVDDWIAKSAPPLSKYFLQPRQGRDHPRGRMKTLLHDSRLEDSSGILMYNSVGPPTPHSHSFHTSSLPLLDYR